LGSPAPSAEQRRGRPRNQTIFHPPATGRQASPTSLRLSGFLASSSPL
jgi:hypothetical protein